MTGARVREDGRPGRRLAAAVAVFATACGATRVDPAVVDVPPAPPPERPAPAASADAGAPKPARARAIAWITSEPEARARARRGRLPLLVVATAAWAAATAEMDRAVWSDPRVVAAASRFVALRLDLTDAEEGDAEGYAQRYAVISVPEVVVLDGDGRVVDRVSGLATVDRVLAALRHADE